MAKGQRRYRDVTAVSAYMRKAGRPVKLFRIPRAWRSLLTWLNRTAPSADKAWTNVYVGAAAAIIKAVRAHARSLPTLPAAALSMGQLIGKPRGGTFGGPLLHSALNAILFTC